MAFDVVGVVLIQTAFNTHVVGDRYVTKYDFDTNSFEVTKYTINDSVGTVVTSAPNIVLSSQNQGYISRIDTGLSSCDGTTYVNFTRTDFFPFHQKQLAPDSPFCPISPAAEDLEIVSIEAFPASSSTSQDGSILIKCSTSFSPAKVALFDFDYATQGQESDATTGATISNLLPGYYTVIVKDSAGFSQDQSIQVPHTLPNNYGIKWRIEFDAIHGGNQKRLDILERDYTGSITVLSEDDNTGYSPNVLTTKRNLDDFSTSVRPGSCTVGIELSTNNQWDDIRLADDEKYLLEHYEYESSVWTLHGKYFSTPELYSDPYFNARGGFASITGTDRLKDLQNHDFGLVGLHDQITILNHCLSKTGLNQAIRCGINIYETSHNKTSSDDPLKQTFIDCSASYYDDDNEPMNCMEVIEHTLTPYHAHVCSYEGYFYLLRVPELKATFNYREFTTLGAYSSNGSIDPVISFTAGQTDKIWRGVNVSRTNAPNYRNIGIIRQLKNKESLIPAFTEQNLNPQNPTTGIKGLTGILNGDTGAWTLSEYEEGKYDLCFDFNDGQGGNAHILRTGSIEYVNEDIIKVEIDFKLTPPRNSLGGNEPLYCVFRWQLKLGTRYLQQDGTWTTTEVINEYFVDQYDKYTDFTIEASLPDVTGTQTEDYLFTVYDLDPKYTHVSGASNAAMITAIKAIDVTNYPFGSRLVGGSIGGISSLYFYYELQESTAADDDVNVIVPTTTGGVNKKWILQKQQGISPNESVFKVRRALVNTLPLGIERKEEVSNTLTANSQNIVDFEKVIYHFDVPDEINNSEEVVANYMRLSDGSPTTLWAESGDDEKRLDVWLGLNYVSLTQKGANLLNGSFISNVTIKPYHVIKEVVDDNRVYLALTLNSSLRRMEFQGQLLEIGSDIAPVELRAHSDAYSNAYS